MPKVGYKHSAEHNANISAGVRRTRDPTRRRRYSGWDCPAGFEDFYDTLVIKVGKIEARRLIEKEAERAARRTSCDLTS